MVRRNLILIGLLVVGGVALFLMKKEGSSISSRSADADKISNSESETIREDQLQASLKPQDKMQQTEISSHGEERAFVRGAPMAPVKPSKAIREPQNLRSSVMLSPAWKVWEGMTAVPQAAGERPDSVALISGYYLVMSASEGSVEESFSVEEPLVVYDSRKSLAGVVTGTLEVQLHPGVNPQNLSQDYALKVLHILDGTNIIYVTSQAQPFDLKSLQESLKNDERIQGVNLEILSRQYDKN